MSHLIKSTLFANSAIFVSGTYKEFSRTNSSLCHRTAFLSKAAFTVRRRFVLLKAIFAGGRVYVIT